MVGARTGLSTVVCGVLFLLTVLFAAPIASIVPASATGPIVFVACLPVVQALKYVDYSSPVRHIPSLLAFFLMTLTNSIGPAVAFSYVVLFAVFVFSSKDWYLLTPQMVASFSICATLLLIITGVIQTVDGLGAVVGGFAFFSIVVGLLMIGPFAQHFYISPGLVSNSGRNDRSNKDHSSHLRASTPPIKLPLSKAYSSSPRDQSNDLAIESAAVTSSRMNKSEG